MLHLCFQPSIWVSLTCWLFLHTTCWVRVASRWIHINDLLSNCSNSSAFINMLLALNTGRVLSDDICIIYSKYCIWNRFGKWVNATKKKWMVNMKTRLISYLYSFTTGLIACISYQMLVSISINRLEVQDGFTPFSRAYTTAGKHLVHKTSSRQRFRDVQKVNSDDVHKT